MLCLIIRGGRRGDQLGVRDGAGAGASSDGGDLPAVQPLHRGVAGDGHRQRDDTGARDAGLAHRAAQGLEL